MCDNAAGEVCPLWPGQPLTAHWPVADPAAVTGNDEKKRKAFFVAYQLLQTRIALLVYLLLDKLDRLALQDKLRDIGRSSD